MRRFLPVIVLIVLAPLVAEVLPGSTPLTMPTLLLSDLLIYGPGALLMRELVRRQGRGWASILLLGAAYGVIEEGLALQSLFNPAYHNVSHWGARIVGINGVYTEAVIVIHMVWSAAIPILLTDLLFPTRRATPYLRRFGLIVTGLWYLLGVALLGLTARVVYPYQTPPVLLGLAAMLALVLTVVALGVLPRPGPRPLLPVHAPQPWVVLLLTGGGVFVWHALLALLWRIQPAFAHGPLVAVPMLSALVVAAGLVRLVRHWARAQDWSDRHLLALAGGALVAHTLAGDLIFTKTSDQGMAVVAPGLLLIVLLTLLAIRVRAKVRSNVGPPAESDAGAAALST